MSARRPARALPAAVASVALVYGLRSTLPAVFSLGQRLCFSSAPPQTGVHSTLRLQAGLALRAASPPRGLVLARAASSATLAEAGTKEDYEALSARLKEAASLEGIAGLLSWDETTMMPPSAVESRAAQKTALASVIHTKHTDPEVGVLLGRLSDAAASGLDEYQQATVREAARDYRKATAIPEELVRRESQLESRGYHAWVKAREEKDWSIFAPVLKDWVAVRRERAALIDSEKPTYDVLVDDYSAGVTAERITEIFDGVKLGIVKLLKDLRTSGSAPDSSWLQGEYDTEKQAALCKEVAVALGFDLKKGRLDVSVHPFTGGAHPTDVRMTTRFKPNDLMEGLTGTIHETGHALYEQGRNLEFDGLPVNAAAGMAIHESQSLLWERMVGLSPSFAEYLLPRIRTAFPDALPGERTADDLYAAVNQVKDVSMIRVEADEVTYPLHVILRFEIEKGLLEGTVDVDDVPRLWNEKMKEYLGVEPEDDAQGCLQDVHWSLGAMGYFPTYSLGAMAAVQIFNTAKAELPNLDSDIAAGNFVPLREWLNKRVHALGSLHPTADDLLVAVTGKPLDTASFLQYLEDKYKALYKMA